MNKIPTIFERDWAGDRSRVTGQPVPGTGWVFAGEGVATRKYDGTSCMIDDDGKFWKRHEVRPGKAIPLGFIDAEAPDPKTEKRVGWVPVGDGPEDKWHRQAYDNLSMSTPMIDRITPGTYELLGPKIQGNPEGFDQHVLLRHADAERLDVYRTFDDLRHFFMEKRPDIEGIVFHHPDGRMAKIKARDFGLKRRKVPVAA